MDKPNITEGEWGIHHTDLGEFIIIGTYEEVCEIFESPQEAENAQAIKAVPEMIDALIYVLKQYYNGETMPFDIEVVERALEKAGVEKEEER